MRKLKPEEKHLVKVVLNTERIGRFLVIGKSADNLKLLNRDTGKELNIRY